MSKPNLPYILHSATGMDEKLWDSVLAKKRHTDASWNNAEQAYKATVVRNNDDSVWIILEVSLKPDDSF